VRDVALPSGLTEGRFESRRSLRSDLDTLARFADPAAGDPVVANDSYVQQGYDLVTSPQAQRAFDIILESDRVRDRYGRNAFGQRALLARRLVESGVRFVQIYDWGWDHHGVSPGEDILNTLPIKVQQVDRALSGLVRDLKQRGLFEETLIVWGGEFGRTPMAQNSPSQPFVGRDHHPYAFTVLLAGGGIKGGQTFGQTDDIGYYVTENPTDVRDLQALVLHLLGLDPWRLTFANQGLQQRLIGVEGKAKIHKQLLA